ncbi:unnamed protein product, partial [Didymodactylos carnosus]
FTSMSHHRPSLDVYIKDKLNKQQAIAFSYVNDSQSDTVIIQTSIQSNLNNFDIRSEFCGAQDFRLNELRAMTNCVIDVKPRGVHDPFSNVAWTIKHENPEIREFVVKRLQNWAKKTQIICDLYYEDFLFKH